MSLQNVKDRDKAMMEMKRELKKLQVRVLIERHLEAIPCDLPSFEPEGACNPQIELGYACYDWDPCVKLNKTFSLMCVQRIREQIRTWANDATIRDTTLLIEARRAIEHQMVGAWHAINVAHSYVCSHAAACRQRSCQLLLLPAYSSFL